MKFEQAQRRETALEERYRQGLDRRFEAQSAYNSSAFVFLVTESAATHDACRLTISTVSEIQAYLHDTNSHPMVNRGSGLNRKIADNLRQFQVAARAELEVGGIETSEILMRRSEREHTSDNHS